MYRSVLVALLLLMSTNPAISYELQAHVVNYQITSGRVVTVSGVGARHVTPDQACITFTCKNFNEKPQVAYDQNEAACKKLSEVLSELHVQPHDIQTSEVTVDAVYSREPTAAIKPLGYRVERTFSILIGDLSLIPKLVSRAVGAGVTEVGTLRYDTSKMRATKDEARLMAVRAAKEKAEAIASELKYKLGKALAITDLGSEVKDLSNNQSSIGQYNDTYAGKLTDETHEGFEPGQLVVSSSISVTFEILE